MTRLAFDERDAKSPRQLTANWLGKYATTAAGDLPELGTIEFIRLSDTDPRKLAAVFRAAAAWFRHTDPEQIRADLLDELEAADWARRQWAAAEYKRAVDVVTREPRRAEILRRRGQAA